MKHIFVNLMLLAAFAMVQAQVPSTDIFISDISTDSRGEYIFSEPLNITAREGYDNQPFFDSNGLIYYTSLRDSTGTDIYRYDPSDKKHLRITKSAESEYSPTPVPGSNDISVVRVDKDSLQRLYQVRSDGKTARLILKDQDSVGYHCWIDEKKLALFILGEPATLRFIDMTTQTPETVASGIGRCISRIPGTGEISFVEKTKESGWFIKAYFPDSKKTAFLMQTLEGSEDYAWTPDKNLLMGKNGKLYISDPYSGKPWKEIADFSRSAGNFYRLAVSNDGKRIAFVSYKGNKP